jgi:hypothetical protein
MKSYLNKFYALVGFMLLVFALPAKAHHGHGVHHHRWHSHHHHHLHRAPVIIHRDNWVAPLIGGVIIGAAVNEVAKRNENKTVIIERDNDTQVVCSEWREIQTSEGQIYRERICRQQ